MKRGWTFAYDGGQPPMDTIGLDLHERETPLCVLDPGRDRQGTADPHQPRALHRHLEALGHAVIVTDPNYAPMYATRTRRVQTDRRDVRTWLRRAGSP